jgi:hypothetical protein
MLTRTSWSRSSFSRPKVSAKLIPTGSTILSGNTHGEHGYVFQSGYQTRSMRYRLGRWELHARPNFHKRLPYMLLRHGVWWLAGTWPGG